MMSSTAARTLAVGARRFAPAAATSRFFSASGLKDAYENILVEKKENVAVITLNRPKALNALNSATCHDLIHATQALDDDKDVGCMVLTGSQKAFAAGADISEMSTLNFEQVFARDMFHEWGSLGKLKQTPLIASVSGYALGGGCELAMMCDFIVCGENAKFGQPEVTLGVIAGMGGSQRLTRLVGKSKSMYMNLTGEFIDSKEALSSGLVAKVFPDDQLMDETMKIANKIAGFGTISIAAAKEAVNANLEMPLQEGLRVERRLFHSLFATEDQKEGMTAFLEKRKPNFKKTDFHSKL